MSEDKRARLKQWLESGEAKLHPLTFPQRELWEASPVPVTDPTNQVCCLINVKGLITFPDCVEALRRVVERQEVLRLSFVPGKDQPLQLVRRSTGEPNISLRELSPAQSTPEAIEELAQELFREPFDLVQAPLYRATLLRRAVDDHAIVFTIHHAIADGWTLGVFVQDLFGAYLQGMMGVREALPPVPQTYSAWGAAERNAWPPAELAEKAAYWKTALAGSPRLWKPSEESNSQAPIRWLSAVPTDVTAAARELARRSGATLFNTLLAAFQVALSHWTGEDDLVVGTPVANRSRPAVRETMGSYSAIVPLRGQVDRGRSFSESLRAVQQTTVDAFTHAMPFAELVKAVGERSAPGSNPIFNVRFALQNHPVPDVSFPTLGAKLRMRWTGTARFDLACELTEKGDALEIAWLFRPGQFPQAEIEDLESLFQNALSSACRSPDSRIAALLS